MLGETESVSLSQPVTASVQDTDVQYLLSVRPRLCSARIMKSSPMPGLSPAPAQPQLQPWGEWIRPGVPSILDVGCDERGQAALVVRILAGTHYGALWSWAAAAQAEADLCG